jgi:hypothetical protein
MTRLLWDETVPFRDTVPLDRLRERMREQQDRDWAELRRRLPPPGLDQQGRYQTRQIEFTDSDLDHSTVDGRVMGIYALILSALAMILIVSWVAT